MCDLKYFLCCKVLLMVHCHYKTAWEELRQPASLISQARCL